MHFSDIILGKGKVVPVLLTEHEAIKAYLWSGGIAPLILLTSVLDGGEWSASCPSHFTRRERAPGTHWVGGWVRPRADNLQNYYQTLENIQGL
jgi:hypothetical protein